MKISALERCFVDMDVRQYPLLSQLIASSDLKATDIREILDLTGSVKGQIQLAIVAKSIIKSILITTKNSLINIPALKALQFIKPENINTALTEDEHRSIILYSKDGNRKRMFSSPIFQTPTFQIGKNMLISMVLTDLSQLITGNNSTTVPVNDALKKLDDYFETQPDSPISEKSFTEIATQYKTIPTPNMSKADSYNSLLNFTKQLSVSSNSSTSSSLKRSNNEPIITNSPKQSKINSNDSPLSFLSDSDNSEHRYFENELAEIFPPENAIQLENY